MTPFVIITVLLIYFAALIGIAYYTSRGSDTDAFFTGNRNSPWYLVAFGMIGASLSGVTFISVPGAVKSGQFHYFQMVLGYLIGYAFILWVLMPLYYRLGLVSIYGYLKERFGFGSYRSGSAFFLISRTIGAAFRLFIAAKVLQVGIFDAWHVPFWLTTSITVGLIWVYTFRGGIKTIVWTDTFQTTFLVGALILSISFVANELQWTMGEVIDIVDSSDMAVIFDWNWRSDTFFVKQLVSGAFIAIVMTGMDQDLMQKNLTCKNIKEAQWNMASFCAVLVVVNYLFLVLGVMLYQYGSYKGIALPSTADEVYPYLAFRHFGTAAGILFLLGITASTYASADSALASLTTVFCIDFLQFESIKEERRKAAFKLWVHLGFSVLILLVILVFDYINNQSVITAVFKVAGYTYGPLLGLFFFGLFTRYRVRDSWVMWICLAGPVLSYLFQWAAPYLLYGYKVGFELLLFNGAVVYLGLYSIRQPKAARNPD